MDRRRKETGWREGEGRRGEGRKVSGGGKISEELNSSRRRREEIFSTGRQGKKGGKEGENEEK